MVRLTDSERAMLRSQSGPLAGGAFELPESCRFTLVSGSLVPPLTLAPPSLHISVGVAVKSTPLATTEMHVPELGFGGGGVSQLRAPGPNAMLRDFDLVAPNLRDQRRLEILADGLPAIWRGAACSGQHWCRLCIVTVHHIQGG